MWDERVEDDEDPYLQKAIEIVINEGMASTSIIQRELQIGYTRAARIIDQLEERGIISGYQGSKPREVLITKERWNNLKNEVTTKETLDDKVRHINHIIQVMDDNDLGYQDFVQEYGGEEDQDNNTRTIFKLSMFVFINYIVNSNLLAIDYDVIKRYIGTDFGDADIENEYIFEQVFGKEYENKKLDPVDWYCFYMQNDELLKNGLLANEDEKIVDSLIEVYKEIGLKIVENGYDNEQRRIRVNCKSKRKSVKLKESVREKAIF